MLSHWEQLGVEYIAQVHSDMPPQLGITIPTPVSRRPTVPLESQEIRDSFNPFRYFKIFLYV